MSKLIYKKLITKLPHNPIVTVDLKNAARTMDGEWNTGQLDGYKAAEGHNFHS